MSKIETLKAEIEDIMEACDEGYLDSEDAGYRIMMREVEIDRLQMLA